MFTTDRVKSFFTSWCVFNRGFASFSLRHNYVHAPRDFFFYLIGELLSRSTAAKDGLTLWNAPPLNAEADRVQASLRFCTQANVNVLK